MIKLQLKMTLFYSMFLLFLLLNQSLAHSHKPSPLSNIYYPDDLNFDIIPRDPHSNPHLSRKDVNLSPSIHHDDSLRISFYINDEQFNLHLNPNHDLFHPNAKVNYFSKGFLSHVEYLQKENFKIFQGFTLSSQHSDKRLAEDTARVIRYEKFKDLDDDHIDPIRGWARITIHDDGIHSNSPPQFEGSFTFDGELYHVKTPTSYLSTMGDEDPIPDYHPSRLIIYKDSDTILNANTTTASSCGTDGNFYPSLIDNSLPSWSTLNNINNKPSWTSPIMKLLEKLLGKSSSKFSKRPIVRFAPSDDHTLDRAERRVLKRSIEKRQNDNNVGGGAGDKASSYVDSIGSKEGCPTEQRLVYMGFAADCTYVQHYDSQENARTQILKDVNQISGLYKDSFRISLGVIELNVEEPSCPNPRNDSEAWNVDCSDDISLNDRLSSFSSWRASKGDDGAGLWHLVTKCNSGSQVGVAWIGQLCKTDASQQSGGTSTGTGVSAITRNHWAVSAHEIGHNFGAIHDCEGGCNLNQECCPYSKDNCDAENKYIMSATSSDSATKFSDCTIGNICSAMGSGKTDSSCLVDPSKGTRPIKSLQQCGNGVVEDGEECDGGGETNCCTSDCKFKSGAVCDTETEACCTDNCQFAPSSQVCRPSVDDLCDYEEKCTGDSGACPEDKYKDNGSDCGNGKKCATGLCTSEDDQCKSAGASLGLTSACDMGGDDTCLITCNDPSGNGCVRLQTPLRDGSQCGYGGYCQRGECETGSWQDTFKNWYHQNLQIAIPVTIIIAIAILLVLFGIARCIFGGCGRRRRPGYMAAPPLPPKSQRNKLFSKASPNFGGPSSSPPVPPPNTYSGPVYYPPPQPPMRDGGPPSHWVDPALYNGRDYGR